MDATPKYLREELYPYLRAILDAPDIRTARLLLNKTLCLIGALLMEFDGKWITGKKYLDMSEYLQWQEEQKQVYKQKNIAYIR